MNRANLIGYKIPYAVPTITTVDTTICTAIQTPTSGKLISPNAYTAVVANQDDQRTIQVNSTAVVLPAQNRTSFGLFLPAAFNNLNTIFKCVISVVYRATTLPLNIYPVLGRAPAASPVVSTIAVANQLSGYQVLPHDTSYVSSVSGRMTCDCEVLPVLTPLTSSDYPLCLALVIENTNGSTVSLSDLNASMSFSRYVQDYPAYSPNGR